jgi:hypothetical protein
VTWTLDDQGDAHGGHAVADLSEAALDLLER